MADPDLELDDPTQRYGNAPPGTLLPPMDPGETGPPSRTLSPTAAEGIHIPPTARSVADNAAIANLMKPRPTTAAEAKPHPSEGFDKAQDQRPAKSAPHQKAPARNYSDLGRPPPDTVLPPHPWELPNVLHSIGGIFSEIGGRVTNNLGLASQKGTDAYWNQRDKSRRANDEHAAARARLEYENMVLSHQRLQEQVETELIDYRGAMYGDPRKIQQQLLDVAKKHLDPKLEFIVTHQGVQKGLEYLQQMDQAFQDLRMSNSQVQKIQQENAGGDAALFRPPDPERPIDAPSSDQPPSDQPSLGQPATPVGAVPLVVAPPADQGAPSAQAPVAPAPAQPPSGAPSAAPVAPGAAAAPTDQGGFSPSIDDASPQGAAGPVPDTSEGVQVAGGGIEDVPRNWYEKMPPVQGGAAPAGEAPYEWTEPPSQAMVDARSALSGRPITNTTLVNNDARRAIQDPGYIDELRKQGSPQRARMALTRATEILQNLNSIATDRHPAGPWIAKAINKEVPGLGDTVQQIAKGQIAPPLDRQLYGRDPYPRLIAKLVAKIDPSMANHDIYMGRYKNLMSYGPQGVQGKYVMSMVTSLHHVSENLQMIRELDQLAPGILGTAQETAGLTARALPGESVLGPLLRRPAISLAGKAGPNAARIEELLSRISANQEFVVEETARAASGAAPHNMEMKSLAAAMDISKNPNKDAIAAGEQFVRLLQARLRQSADQFVTSTGANPKQNLANYLGKYLPGYTTLNDQPVGPDDLSPEIRQLLGDPSAALPAQSPSIDDIMRKYGG